jgi:hypothetical protein
MVKRRKGQKLLFELVCGNGNGVVVVAWVASAAGVKKQPVSRRGRREILAQTSGEFCPRREASFFAF